MSTWSILIISTGLLAADARPDGAAKVHSASAPVNGCVRVVSEDSISPSGITQLEFETRAEQVEIQQTGYSPACAAPVNCAPACCTPVSCAAAAQYGCGQSYGACYSQTCGNYCCEKQSCCDRCKNRCYWHRAHTTGDMFPHYAYYPQHHGYYYFRPYNWMHVLEHQARIVAMGGDSRNPYSVAIFDPIYEDFEQRFPQILEPPAGSVQPLGSGLPNLEDLMNNGD
jgi:hypothetical protein